jgi:transposase InsO family protein
MRTELQKSLFTYNHFRPHKNLKGITPMDYIQNNIIRDPILSQII